MTTGQDSADPSAATAEIDESRLQRLLTMAGPVVAAELLAQMVQDFHSAGQALQRAMAVADLHRIRIETHILSGLAGTVGAHGLEADARALNAVANLGTIRPDLGPRIASGLNQMAALIARHQQALQGGLT